MKFMAGKVAKIHFNSNILVDFLFLSALGIAVILHISYIGPDIAKGNMPKIFGGLSYPDRHRALSWPNFIRTLAHTFFKNLIFLSG